MKNEVEQIGWDQEHLEDFLETDFDIDYERESPNPEDFTREAREFDTEGFFTEVPDSVIEEWYNNKIGWDPETCTFID